MQPLTLINGSATRTLASSDRGLNFGQGVSTRIKVVAGKAQLWREHMALLQRGCSALGFHINAVEKLVKRDLGLIPKADLSLRVTLTAGLGSTTLLTPAEFQPTRILQIEPTQHPEPPVDGVEAVVCDTRLAVQPRLAGIKHLSRLEQLLARAEWRDQRIFDGVMLDTDGVVVGGTRANLFWATQGQLFTPDLSRCGVSGAMRAAILRLAQQLQIPTHEVRASLDTLLGADEIFFCNSALGILPVKALAQNQYAVRSDTLTARLSARLSQVLYD